MRYNAKVVEPYLACIRALFSFYLADRHSYIVYERGITMENLIQNLKISACFLKRPMSF